MSRRATLGGPLSSSSQHNIDANARKSLGGKFAPVSKTTSRMSMAPATSSSSSRQSLAPSSSRMSMAPSSSRPSMGGRNSIGSRNALMDRKSGGGRRSSMGAGSSASSRGLGVRSDPRPISDKAFMRENIKKFVTFLTAHKYDGTISAKQLFSPSTKEFKDILLFLFQHIDPNFQFQPANFEDQVKGYMKRFGYPFAISKNALQAAGSPHTWPSLLAMMCWLVEFLQYHEAVYGENGVLPPDSEVRMFYEYAVECYTYFMLHDDPTEAFQHVDEALAKKFEEKNAAVSEEIAKFQSRQEENQGEIERFKAASASLSEYLAFRKACQQDIPALEENIKNNHAYLDSVKAKKAARQAELEKTIKQLEAAEAEKADLQQQLAKQVFTPLQVQEMMHQKSTLESTLESQQAQQEQVQNEIWNREMETVKKMSELEKVVGEFNELSSQLASSSAKSSSPFHFEEVKFNPSGDCVSTLLSVDLKSQKEALMQLKESLAHHKKEVLIDAKRQSDSISALLEQQAERQASVENLSKRATKIADLYTEERAKMNRQVELSCSAVEDVELDIVKLRNQLSALGMDGGSAAQQLQSIEAEMARAEAHFLSEQATLKGEICTMMQELTEHKVNITEQLESMLHRAETVKQNIQQADLKQIAQQH